jgi:thioredoxin reductase (NADPH)
MAGTMPLSATYAARRDQMFPTLPPDDIARMRRFGEAATFAAGERIVRAGEVAPGLIVVVSGQVEISQDGGDRRETIVVHGPGSFAGELAQLSERPSLVTAEAIEPVNAFVIPSRRLRDLMVQEANLGERVMRALILRRVGLLESGGIGPIIIGHQNSGDLLRLQGFLARSGHPHRALAAAGQERHLLETSRSGVFAIGDVRSGSVKRVAAAVGEGAQVVAALHAYLAGQSRQPSVPQSMRTT